MNAESLLSVEIWKSTSDDLSCILISKGQPCPTSSGRRPGESYHMICSTGVTCRHTCMLTENTDLAFCVHVLAMKIIQAPTENNIKHKKTYLS